MTGAEVLMSKFVCDMAVMLDENAALQKKLADAEKRIAELDAALLEAAAQRKKPSVILRAAGRDASLDTPVDRYNTPDPLEASKDPPPDDYLGSRLILRSDVDSAEPATLENGHG